MKTLIRTTDPTLISHVDVILREGGVDSFVLDENVSNLYGSAGVVPRSISVIDEDYGRARRLVSEAGLAHELEPEDAPKRGGFLGLFSRRRI